MRRVRRDEILDYETYGEQRDAIRSQVLRQKERRRVHVGDHLTFLFENADTVRYQVLEMVRTERIVREAEIQHELETYNEILGDTGELGCTLLIEVPDPDLRRRRLVEWRDLPQFLYAKLEDGSRVRPTYDERQIGDDKLSSVQFLRFPVGGRVPVAIGADHPALTAEAVLTPEQRAALAEDLLG